MNGARSTGLERVSPRDRAGLPYAAWAELLAEPSEDGQAGAAGLDSALEWGVAQALDTTSTWHATGASAGQAAKPQARCTRVFTTRRGKELALQRCS